MPFSFANLGFWRLVVVTLTLVLLHAILAPHWPAIRGSRLGVRPLPAVLFMFVEALSLFATVAAAIGSVTKLARLPARSISQIVMVPMVAIGLSCIFFYLWQS
jgi:hypothetical protein